MGLNNLIQVEILYCEIRKMGLKGFLTQFSLVFFFSQASGYFSITRILNSWHTLGKLDLGLSSRLSSIRCGTKKRNYKSESMSYGHGSVSANGFKIH